MKLRHRIYLLVAAIVSVMTMAFLLFTASAPNRTYEDVIESFDTIYTNKAFAEAKSGTYYLSLALETMSIQFTLNLASNEGAVLLQNPMGQTIHEYPIEYTGAALVIAGPNGSLTLPDSLLLHSCISESPIEYDYHSIDLYSPLACFEGSIDSNDVQDYVLSWREYVLTVFADQNTVLSYYRLFSGAIDFRYEATDENGSWTTFLGDFESGYGFTETLTIN